jgi:hypothetical protein
MMNAIGAAWGTVTEKQQLEIRDSVLQSLITILQNSMTIKRRAVNKPVETAFISLLLHIFTRDSSKVEKQCMEQLRVMTMRYIIKMLTRLAKENDLVLLRDIELLITALVDYYPTSLDQWDKLLAISLKLGISDIFDDQTSLFIKIARRMVSACAGTKQSDDFHMFSSARVHDMILSHSKFRNVMESDSSTRKELIALMVCCVSLSNGPIEAPEHDKIALLLLKYRGSVSNADRFLRFLLQLYDRHQEIKVRQDLYLSEHFYLLD